MKCDNAFGADIERVVPALLMPNDVNNLDEWNQLPIVPKQIDGVFDTPLNVGIYNYDEKDKSLIARFATLTAWRALHAMDKEQYPLSVKFLESDHGRKIDAATRSYLTSSRLVGSDSSKFTTAELYYLGPNQSV